MSSGRRVGETNSLVMLSLPNVLKIIMKSQNNGIKLGDHGRLKSQTLKFKNSMITVFAFHAYVL
jgi:hypothetical protein